MKQLIPAFLWLSHYICLFVQCGKPEDYEMPAILKSRWSWQGNLYRTFKFLFASGVTPQMLIRTMGPWGYDLVGGYVRRRFQEGIGVASNESECLQSYFYHISAAKPCGEHALKHIFHPIAWGKDPLEGRLSNLKVPVSFVYGASDWMDPKSAAKVCQNIEARKPERSCNADRSIRMIPQAGHFVFLDQPVRQVDVHAVCVLMWQELFNEELLDLCKDDI